MANYKDINDYRRRKKIKQVAAKIILVSLILGILFVLLNVLQIFKGSRLEDIILMETSTEPPAFPLAIKNEQPVDLYNIGSNFAVLTKANLLLYNLNGSKTAAYSHGYTNPVVKEGTKRLLTYDRGGNKLRVDAPAGTVGELTTDNSIICAEIALNGNVAVAMSYKNYTPVIIVYNSNLKEIYHYTEAKDFTALSFSPDGSKLAACSVESQEGLLCAAIYEMDITQKTPARITTVSNILPLGISYQSDGGLAIVGKDRLARLPASGKSRIPQYYEYTGELQRFAQSGDLTVILQKNLFNTESTACVFSPEGKLKASCAIPEEAVDFYTDGSRLLILGKKNLYNYDMKLSPLNNPIPLTKSSQKVIFSGEDAFAMSTDSVERYRIS